MHQNTDTEPPVSVIRQTQEITNFEISVSNRLYWISYKDKQYPIIMRLFDIEGLPIEGFTGDESAYFNKTILLLRNVRFSGDLFDEEGYDISPQECRVKESIQLDSLNP